MVGVPLVFNYDLTPVVKINSGGVVSAVLEKQLAPAVSFTLCGMLDHSSGQSRFGIGLTIGQ